MPDVATKMKLFVIALSKVMGCQNLYKIILRKFQGLYLEIIGKGYFL